METGSLDQVAFEAVSHNDAIRKRVLLRRGRVPHVMQVARAVFPPGEIAEAHAHEDMWEHFLCESGSGSMVVDGREIPLGPGTFVLVEPRECHEVRNTGNTQLVLTVFGVQGPPDTEGRAIRGSALGTGSGEVDRPRA